ncbi:MAG: WYL domain-containing protein [Oscillospiraceae bacterium]|nr:WYL domain-containing protein [Oscillospiraceae bacterium]
MKQPNQKLKLMYLSQILLEQTDEEHTLTVQDMIAELSKLGISAERKSVYDDIEYLRLFGLDICSRKSRTTDYFVASREFELPELKLLVDSVQSSKFITHKKSMELISKIEKLTSRENAKKLHRQVFVTNRVKTLNEQIYYNVDKIHDAIAANRMITFRYFDLDVNKKKVYRKNGELYTESPVSLTWDDENYYLITYKQKYGRYVHYRVDRMESIELTENERCLGDEDFDLSAHSKRVFHMFNGSETEVTVKFANELVGVVYDRFGVDIPIIKTDENHFTCRVKVAVSPHFLSWIISFGSRAKILAPQNVVDELRALVGSIAKMYEE